MALAISTNYFYSYSESGPCASAWTLEQLSGDIVTTTMWGSGGRAVTIIQMWAAVAATTAPTRATSATSTIQGTTTAQIQGNSEMMSVLHPARDMAPMRQGINQEILIEYSFRALGWCQCLGCCVDQVAFFKYTEVFI